MNLKKYLISFAVVILCGISQLYSQSLNNRIDSLISLMSAQDKINQLINNAFGTTPANTTLGIPGFNMCDGPHGVRCQTATAFPVGMAMASTWDISMIRKVGQAMGEEFWAYGYNQQLGPCIDLCRDPRAGRSAESGGEDPFLNGQIAAAVTKGIQTTPVIATVKHFEVESKQAYRTTCNEIFTERWMMEHYGYNFRTAMQEGACFSIMDAYNLINGVHCAENAVLLDTTLRKRWGFPFYVVSDWGAVNSSENSIIAGTDVCMGSSSYQDDLPSLVSGGQVTTAILNTAVANVLRTKILSGMMDYYPTGDASLENSTDHQQVALNAARESIILLKNANNILPLSKSTINKIAVIGPNANVGNLNCFGSSETFPPFSVTDLQGIETKISSSNVVYTQGCAINSSDTSGFAAARTYAKQADYVIFVGGLDETQEGENYCSGSICGNDRASGLVELPGKQQDLINALAVVNKNIIVVLHSGGVCAIDSCINNIKGLIYSFYPGMEAGTAVADVLFGDYNPGGRMPVTMPKNTGQLPTWDDDFTNDYGCGYRWFDQNSLTPEFAFGSGLSYTTFEYSNLQISPTSAPAGSPIQVSVDVQNTGSVLGDEVVQLYLTNNMTALWMPKKELKGFNRITLNPGEKQTVIFTLGSEELYFWSETDKRYEVSPNSYVVKVGGSSDNLPLSGSLDLSASSGKPDLKITQIFTMPRFPLTGQRVVFYALVKNQGNASITPSNRFNLSFTIDTSEVAVANNVSATIQPGQAMLIESTTTNWIAPYSGKFLIGAVVDKNNSIDEWVETNNTFSRTFEVYDNSINLLINDLAYKKPVKVSSVQNNDSTYAGSKAVDGNETTRWSSQFADPQYLVVDLENNYNLTKIIINWEAAYAKNYQILVSSDSVKWDTVKTITAGYAGLDTFKTTKSARYVKLNCTQRGTVWGYSIYELIVYGVINTPPVANAGGDQSIILPIDNLVLDGSASTDTDGDTLSYTWEQLSGPLTAVLTGANTSKLSVNGLTTAGSYVFKLIVSDGKAINSDIATVNVTGTMITSINNKLTVQDVLIYPNPASDKLFVKTGDIPPGLLILYDLTGRPILQQNINCADVIEINVSDYAKGLYLLIIQGNEGRIVKKVEIR